MFWVGVVIPDDARRATFLEDFYLLYVGSSSTLELWIVACNVLRQPSWFHVLYCQ